MPNTASVCSVIGTGQNGTLILAAAIITRLPSTARPIWRSSAVLRSTVAGSSAPIMVGA